MVVNQKVKRGLRLCKHDNLHEQTTTQRDCTIELISLKQRRSEHSYVKISTVHTNQHLSNHSVAENAHSYLRHSDELSNGCKYIFR